MKFYIIEDDPTVISILEDIVERNALGSVCGDTADAPADPPRILTADPDIILIDLLMPEKDGIQLVRELRDQGCGAKFIMISQVSSKEMIAKAYTAGVEFFIQKPINLIEVRTVISTVVKQLENERALKAIQNVFAGRAPAPPPPSSEEKERRRMKYILSQLGMAGEKGAQDIMGLCAQLSDNPKTMEQRARRALDKGLSHIASLGLEDYSNEVFVQYSARLFPFQEVRAEMNALKNGGPHGKVNLKQFLDGMLAVLEAP